MVSAAYSQLLGASGGTQPYTWQVTSGSLPGGMTLDTSTGLISGTPSVLGTSSFTVQCTDSAPTAAVATRALSITVAPAGGTLSITTSSLPAGTQGSAYSATLTATGGTTPYTWSITAGALHAGLSLTQSTGSISGTPGASGSSNITFMVTDSGTPAQTDTKVLPLAVNSSGSQYDPAWGGSTPASTIQFTYNSGQTSEQNWAALAAAMNALTPGQKLVIGAGTYTKTNFYNLTCSGNATAPIWIEAAAGATVVINHSGTSQNILNVGSGSPVRYLAIRNIEFTGGSHGIRFYDCQNIWFDRNKVHGTGDAGISTNTNNTSFMHITRNEIYDTDGTGEGMYLGANNGAVIMSQSIIALNHVHHTNKASVTQGDGIELKQGSWGNLIAENLVHDCKYPCILVYGTAGQAQNIVERNTCYNSGDNAMQIQGECIVRNNLVINATGSAFASQYHQGNPTNLQVIHNTFVNSGRAVNLSAWQGASNMVFANNVCYSQSSDAIRFATGNTGVTCVGNVIAGALVSVPAGATVATGNTANPLADFTNVTWNATSRNALPVAGCAIIGAGNATHAVTNDITGATRAGSLESGCYDRP
ncbi:hypothetical protein EDM80_15305 [bacterium]|nr:MAG: hypothetical protein EDM80_15305 [bacterium]